MTTKAWVFPIRQDTDAGFRAWGADLSQSFVDVGLVKTTDTGQIDWTTATRVAGGSYAGYEIWRFTDSSIFLKFEFGSAGSSISNPQIRVTVGTGSNGSGTLTGTVSDARNANGTVSGGSGVSSPGTNRQSLMCYKDGFFGFLLYNGALASNISYFFFAVARTTDVNGTPDSNGAVCYWYASSSSSGFADIQALNFTANTARTRVTDGSYSFVPQSISSSLVGSDTQAFMHWVAYPRVRPNMYMLTVVSAEFAYANTFQTSVVGTTPRTYIAFDSTIHGQSTGSTTYKLAMLWE